MRGLFIITRHDAPGYDEAVEMLVCAGTEREARRVAADSHADEPETEWLDRRKSKCSKVGTAAPRTARGVLMQDGKWS